MANTKMTWLQCTLPQSEWDLINGRRIKLNLKWVDVIKPGVLAYLDKLEGKAGEKAKVKKQPIVKEQQTETSNTEQEVK